MGKFKLLFISKLPAAFCSLFAFFFFFSLLHLTLQTIFFCCMQIFDQVI